MQRAEIAIALMPDCAKKERKMHSVQGETTKRAPNQTRSFIFMKYKQAK